MKVPWERLQRQVTRLLEQVVERGSIEHKFRTIPTSFRSLQGVNNGEVLPDEETLEVNWVQQRKETIWGSTKLVLRMLRLSLSFSILLQL